MDVVDLVTKGTECTVRGFFNFEDGVNCYQDIGYSEQCAKMWVHNGQTTIWACGLSCIPYRLLSIPNNGPLPNCQLNDCLQCDEDQSGPLFKKVAGRTRRRTGLLSGIIRPCDSILLVNHTVPCEFNLSSTMPPATSPPDDPVNFFLVPALGAVLLGAIGSLGWLIALFAF